MNPRIGSLFSGYGGLDMAVRAALGCGRVVWHSDIKPAAVALLAHRHPGTPNLGDITRAFPALGPISREAADLEPIDALAFSYPCQPESAAGKRLGEKDPRALLPNALRAVAETHPALVFVENVARIAGNGSLRRLVTGLADLGYVGAWRCERASNVGACHRRDRCFVVAVDPAAYALGKARWLTRHAVQADRPGPAGVGAAQPGRRDHVAGVTLLPSPAARDFKGPECRGERPDGYARSFRQTDLSGAVLNLLPTPRKGDDIRGLNDATARERAMRSDGGRASATGMSLPEAIGKLLPTPRESDGTKGGPGMRGSSGDLMLPSAVMQLLPSPTVNDSRNGRNATANRSEGHDHHHSGWTLSDVAYADRWGIYAQAIARHELFFGRPAPDPTQISPRNGRPQLAPRFVEWMMMLPWGHVADVPGLTRNQQLSLLGDGVVPAQGAAAFSFLLGHLAQRLNAERAA